MNGDLTDQTRGVPPVIPLRDAGRVAVCVGVGCRMLTPDQARGLAERLIAACEVLSTDSLPIDAETVGGP